MTIEALQEAATRYVARACRDAMEPEEIAEAAFAKLAGLLAAQDATRPVDVDAQCAHMPEEIRQFIRRSIVHWRAERIRTGTASARDLAVAFLLTLEEDDPDWHLAEIACALDAPFVLLLLFGEPPVRRSKTHVVMRWAAAQLFFRVEVTTGHWIAKRAGAPEGEPAAHSGKGYGDLAGLRWDCRRGAALIKLAKLIAQGSATR